MFKSKAIKIAVKIYGTYKHSYIIFCLTKILLFAQLGLPDAHQDICYIQIPQKIRKFPAFLLQ